MEQRDQHDATELVGRQWFVNLRSSSAFDTRPFADSVLVLKATPTYIVVQDYQDRIAVIPWSAIAFLGSTGSVGYHGTPPKA